MNFCPSQVSPFLTKLKGLIRKISKSSSNEIQYHTLACHRLIVQLIKDDQILDGLNGQKLRLLAYEAILYLVEMLDTKKESMKVEDKNVETNLISSYLGDINGTLNDVKELLRRCEMESKSRDTRRSFLPQSNLFSKLDNNLNQYQNRLRNILAQIEQSKNQCKKNQVPITSQKQKPSKDDQHDCLIQEIQRIVEKKQTKIAELVNLLKQAQNKNAQLQVQFNKQQAQYCLRNNQLLAQLQQMMRSHKELEISIQQNVDKALQNYKIQARDKMRLQKQVLNQKIHIQHKKQRKNNTSCKTIQAFTEQTIPSFKNLNHKDSSPRKFSIQKGSSSKSFRRIGYFEDKENTMTAVSNEKKIEEMDKKNQELYILMLSQAATIEQLL